MYVHSADCIYPDSKGHEDSSLPWVQVQSQPRMIAMHSARNDWAPTGNHTNSSSPQRHSPPEPVSWLDQPLCLSSYLQVASPQQPSGNIEITINNNVYYSQVLQGTEHTWGHTVRCQGDGGVQRQGAWGFTVHSLPVLSKRGNIMSEVSWLFIWLSSW